MKIRARKGRENAEENGEENFLFHGVIIPIKSERKTKFVFEAKNNAKKRSEKRKKIKVCFLSITSMFGSLLIN